MGAQTNERDESFGHGRTIVHAAMAAALRSGTIRENVPVVLKTVSGGNVLTSQPIGKAVLDTLDLSIVNRKLLLALRESRCPLLADVKTALISAYADAQAPLMAELGQDAAEVA